MKRKMKIGIIFGGKSAEHEVSLQSAKNIIAALDRSTCEPILIAIDKKGVWYEVKEKNFLKNENDPKKIKLNLAGASRLALNPGGKNGQFIDLASGRGRGVDVIFPALHGTNGEDGTMQGLLKILEIPFVGPGVLGSAAGMDKEVAKRLWRDAGIPIAAFATLRSQDRKAISFAALKKQLGLPMFIKPANAGSSVGVSKVKHERDFKKALDSAFLFDDKVLAEEYVPGREIEVAVLGNYNPEAAAPGEIIPHHEFYSYEAKYIDKDGAAAKIPADLPSSLAKKICQTAIRAFSAVGCEGMSRVDFFVKQDGTFFVNEINTIPGFTNISMYPKLWEEEGVSYSQLVSRLIALALERHGRESKLKTAF